MAPLAAAQRIRNLIFGDGRAEAVGNLKIIFSFHIASVRSPPKIIFSLWPRLTAILWAVAHGVLRNSLAEI